MALKQRKFLKLLTITGWGQFRRYHRYFLETSRLAVRQRLFIICIRKIRRKLIKNTAALLCSAIISDTLIFKSPTCTSDDVAACMQLAKKAELDIETYGREMFRAGSNLSGKSAKEIFYQDYKKFSVNNVAIGVGQINSMSAEELEKVKPRLAEFIQGVVQDNSAGIVYFLLTDIVSESSEVLCAGNNANAVIYQAFGVEVKDACVKLQGVVSRKKQFFPAIVEALQQ